MAKPQAIDIHIHIHDPADQAGDTRAWRVACGDRFVVVLPRGAPQSAVTTQPPPWTGDSGGNRATRAAAGQGEHQLATGIAVIGVPPRRSPTRSTPTQEAESKLHCRWS